MQAIQRSVLKSPVNVFNAGLLILNGMLIAIMLALSNIVTSAGVHPLVYAFWQTVVAGMILVIVSVRFHTRLNQRVIVYFVLSALAGIVVPNTAAFFLVTKLGAGFVGILYALPPVFTFFFAVSLGLERASIMKFSGLSVAVIACISIVLLRRLQLEQVTWHWYMLGFVIPVSLSIGNIYRSVAWPKGLDARSLAAGTLLAASIVISLCAKGVNVELYTPNISTGYWWIIAGQGVLTALTYFSTFELQRRSSPVFYSQIGAVAAVFGLFIGVIFLGERYSVGIWFAVAIVIFGLRLANKARSSVPSSH